MPFSGSTFFGIPQSTKSRPSVPGSYMRMAASAISVNQTEVSCESTNISRRTSIQEFGLPTRQPLHAIPRAPS